MAFTQVDLQMVERVAAGLGRPVTVTNGIPHNERILRALRRIAGVTEAPTTMAQFNNELLTTLAQVRAVDRVLNPLAAAPDRAVIQLVAGVWTAQEYVKLSDGSVVAYGSTFAATTVAAAAGNVTLAGANLTLKSGLTATIRPHLAQVQWSFLLSLFTGLSLVNGAGFAVEITSTANFATINAYLGVAFCFPTGAYDAAAETNFGVSLGLSALGHPDHQQAQAAGVWTSVDADLTDAKVMVQYAGAVGSALASTRGYAAGRVVQTEAASVPAATTPTQLQIVGYAGVAALLADATITAPVITIYYGR